MARQRALRFQYDNGGVWVYKYDPEEKDYILALSLDPDGEIDEWGYHRNLKLVELTDKQLQSVRQWQIDAQHENRRRTGGLHGT